MAQKNLLLPVGEIVRDGNTASDTSPDNGARALAVREISCCCAQCDDQDWPGITAEFMDLIESGSEAFLTHLRTEWRVWRENRQGACRPVWTADELLAIDDRVGRAQIAASEDIDVTCERTRFVLRDLADEGFWGKAAFDRLTPSSVLEKPKGKRRLRKHSKSSVHFDLFGDFGVDVATTKVSPSDGLEQNPSGQPQALASQSSVPGRLELVAIDDFGQSVVDEIWKRRNTSWKHWPPEFFEMAAPSDRALNPQAQDNPFLPEGSSGSNELIADKV